MKKVKWSGQIGPALAVIAQSKLHTLLHVQRDPRAVATHSYDPTRYAPSLLASSGPVPLSITRRQDMQIELHRLTCISLFMHARMIAAAR